MILTAKVHKLYEKLSPEQLAALGYEAVMACDESECEYITDILKKSDYGYTQKYCNQINIIQLIISAWGVDYWKVVAALFACQSLSRKAIEESGVTSKEFSSIFKHLKELSDKEAALKAVLRVVCDKTGVNLGKVLAFLSVDAEIFAIQDGTVDQGFVDECIQGYVGHL